MFKQWIPAVAAVLFLSGCLADKGTITDQFQEVNIDKWNWYQPKEFQFEITEKDYTYDLYCGLRITGSYKYSNIWLIYVIEGPEINEKKQFQIELSDNTGKWLGQGQNNLIAFEKGFIRNLKLKPGKYTVKLSQNMRDEDLAAVSDIGLKVVQTQKVY